MVEPIPFLQIKNVTKSFKGAVFSGIKEVSLEIKPGKITMIIGRSGSRNKKNKYASNSYVTGTNTNKSKNL